MKKLSLALLLIAALMLPAKPSLAASGNAASTSYPWRDHAAPYTFLFGNHIDMHQQTQLSGGSLQGFLYIHYTGETIDGVPVAEHIDCSATPDDCTVGWVLSGVPAQGTVVATDAMGMPLFRIDTPAARTLVGFSHFHWLGLPLEDMDLQVNQSYSGYLLKLTAVAKFYFRHHDMLFLVTPGVDTESHANLVTGAP